MSGRCVTPRLWQNLRMLKQNGIFVHGKSKYIKRPTKMSPQCPLFPAFYSRDSAKKSKKEKTRGWGSSSAFFLFSRLFTVLYFSVISSRSSALRFGLHLV